MFKKNKMQYHLTDIGFGKLVGFDVLKSGWLQPIIWILAKNQSYANPKQAEAYKKRAPNHLEIRLEWNGEHLKANEVTLLQESYYDGDHDYFSTNDLKKHKKYRRLRKFYISEEHEIQKGVKIHWQYNSLSLYFRKVYCATILAQSYPALPSKNPSLKK